MLKNGLNSLLCTKAFSFRKWVLLPILLLAFLLAQGLLRPAGLSAETQADKDAKKAAQQAEKDRKEKAKILKEIIVKKDEKKGESVTDCNMQWVRHQDFFGIQGIEGDLALQFRIDSKKENGRWTPAKTIMVVSIYSKSEAHKNNNGGAVTLDGNVIQVDSSSGYHTDNPMGVYKKGDRIEVMDHPISYEDFKAIAFGKKVKGKIADIEFEVKNFPQTVFKEMASETMPLPVLPAPAPNTAVAP